MSIERNYIVLNYPNFDKEVSDSFILVEFWADWCQACKVLDQYLSEIATEFDGKLKIGKVNADDNRTLAKQFGAMRIPSLLLFKNGEAIEHITGLHPKEKIRSLIIKHI